MNYVETNRLYINNLSTNDSTIDNLIDNLSINEEPLDNLMNNLSINKELLYKNHKEYNLLIDYHKKINNYLGKPIIQKVDENFYKLINEIYEQNTKYLEFINFNSEFYKNNNTYTNKNIQDICLIKNQLNQYNDTYENLSKNIKLWNINNIYKILTIINNAYNILINDILI